MIELDGYVETNVDAEVPMMTGDIDWSGETIENKDERVQDN